MVERQASVAPDPTSERSDVRPGGNRKTEWRWLIWNHGRPWVLIGDRWSEFYCLGDWHRAQRFARENNLVLTTRPLRDFFG